MGDQEWRTLLVTHPTLLAVRPQRGGAATNRKQAARLNEAWAAFRNLAPCPALTPPAPSPENYRARGSELRAPGNSPPSPSRSWERGRG